GAIFPMLDLAGSRTVHACEVASIFVSILGQSQNRKSQPAGLHLGLLDSDLCSKGCSHSPTTFDMVFGRAATPLYFPLGFF
ncbi:MAG TPA: hypothetical protein VNV88_02600, partial [Candidatus Solibacter sp.]|nr:hypothetical protein [Candidatus Solibacter sp.]